jgi:hypothetical protein
MKYELSAPFCYVKDNSLQKSWQMNSGDDITNISKGACLLSRLCGTHLISSLFAFSKSSSGLSQTAGCRNKYYKMHNSKIQYISRTAQYHYNKQI